MSSISQRLNQIPASPIRKLVPFAEAAKKRGVRVIHLNIGDPDIPTPKVMVDRLKTWDEGIPYAQSQGDPELLDALQGYYHNLGYNYLAREDIQVTVGGSEALQLAMTGCLNAGEGMMVFEPFYTNYAAIAAGLDIKLHAVTTTIDTGFHLPSENEIERRLDKNTKAILFTNPNNPTGTVYTREEVEILIRFAKKFNLWLLVDEVYREFVFSNEPGVSLLEYMPDNKDRLVVLDSLSKRYSAPGLRLGMMVSQNKELMAGALRLAMGRLSAGYIDQKVAAQLARVTHAEILEVRDEYSHRRDVIFKGLAKLPGVTIHQPEGAFYCVVQLPVLDSEKFCQWLLTDFTDQGETVMLAPMQGFYLSSDLGKQEVRIAFVVGEKKLNRAVEIIGKALNAYRD